MYYLIHDLDDKHRPYFYCDNRCWSKWHPTLAEALASDLPDTMNSEMPNILSRNKGYKVLIKSETPIFLEDHPELLL